MLRKNRLGDNGKEFWATGEQMPVNIGKISRKLTKSTLPSPVGGLFKRTGNYFNVCNCHPFRVPVSASLRFMKQRWQLIRSISNEGSVSISRTHVHSSWARNAHLRHDGGHLFSPSLSLQLNLFSYLLVFPVKANSGTKLQRFKPFQTREPCSRSCSAKI